jgi:hypothetical protein
MLREDQCRVNESGGSGGISGIGGDCHDITIRKLFQFIQPVG